MKAFKIISSVVVGLAAVAGIVYVVATYGDKIVAWAKKLLHKGCCCDDCACADCECNDNGECTCECDCDECECACDECEEAPEEQTEEVTEKDFEEA